MRLINADAIVYETNKALIHTGEGFIRECDIEREPTIDAKPVEHGHWIRRMKLVPLPLDTEPLDYDDYDEETHSEWVPYWYCSECDYELGTFLSSDNYYCKYCGARMDEVEE